MELDLRDFQCIVLSVSQEVISVEIMKLSAIQTTSAGAALGEGPAPNVAQRGGRIESNRPQNEAGS
jgi:hypothetical protein